MASDLGECAVRKLWAHSDRVVDRTESKGQILCLRILLGSVVEVYSENRRFWGSAVETLLWANLAEVSIGKERQALQGLMVLSCKSDLYLLSGL
jgi:hypothetical protein